MNRAADDALARIGTTADDEIDIAETALLLSKSQRASLNVEPYRRHLGMLAQETASFVRASLPEGSDEDPTPELVAEALEHVLARRHAYHGDVDSYDDLDNADLARVIDRRMGLPVTLAILYLHAGRESGATLEALDFPGHVLVRIESGGQRVIVDPFHGGKPVTPAELRALLKAVSGLDAELTPAVLRPLSDRGVLVRMQNNIKVRLLDMGRLEDALGIVETMLAIAPRTASLWRDAGVLRAKLDRIESAVAALEEFLRRADSDQGRYRVSLLLQELRARLG